MGSQELGVKPSFYIRLFFLCIAVFMAVFSVFEYRKSEENKRAEKQSALIFKPHTRESIIKISFIGQDSSHLILEKTNQKWSLIQPIRDRASSSAVEGLLDELFEESAQILSDENVQWSDYDLNPPFAVVSMHSADEEWKAGIGGSNFEGKFYLKQGSKLLLADSHWGRWSRPWTDTYRSRALYSRQEDISKLHYKKQNESYELIQKNGGWQWDSNSLLSKKAVEDFLDLLKGDLISAFLNKKKKDFSKPDLTVKIFNSRRKDPWILKLKKTSEEKAQVILSDRDFIYELNTAEPLLKVDFKEKEEKNSSKDQPKEKPPEVQ